MAMATAAATITMTMRYSHLMTEHLHRVMERYGAASAGTNAGTNRAKLTPQPSPGTGQDIAPDTMPARKP